MLVLTRQCHEKIRINDDITIVVLAANNGLARIGIEAPTDMKIFREEIYQLRKESEGQRAQQ